MPLRPRSIIRFELVFWLLIALGIAQTALQWDAMLADPRFAPLIGKTGAMPIYIIAFGLVAVLALLWYLIARRGSVIAKWLYVLISIYSIYDNVSGLLALGAVSTAPAILTVVSVVLQLAAVILLFMPDTRAWFGEEGTAS